MSTNIKWKDGWKGFEIEIAEAYDGTTTKQANLSNERCFLRSRSCRLKMHWTVSPKKKTALPAQHAEIACYFMSYFSKTILALGSYTDRPPVGLLVLYFPTYQLELDSYEGDASSTYASRYFYRSKWEVGLSIPISKTKHLDGKSDRYYLFFNISLFVFQTSHEKPS